MIWVFLILASIAITLFLLGAFSVWVVVLSLLVKAMSALFIAAILYFIWQRIYGRKS